MFISEDLQDYVTTFLDCCSRSALRQTCRLAHSNKNLQYDGPLPTSERWVSVLCVKKYTVLQGCNSVYTTNNKYTYCCAEKPVTSRRHYSYFDYLVKLAQDPNVTAGAFTCAWLNTTLDTERTEELVRSIADNMQDETDNQYYKARVVLDSAARSHVGVSLGLGEYVLKCACLYNQQKLIRDAINVYRFQVTDTSLMMSLVSVHASSKERLENIKVLLDHGADVSVHDFWPLKFAVYTEKWEELLLMYRWFLTHTPAYDVTNVENEISVVVGEAQRYNVLYELRECRRNVRSLYSTL